MSPTANTTAPDGGMAGRPTDLRPPESGADEKTTLLTFLDYLRASVVRKTEGVPDEVADRPAVPSGTSLFWLLRHLTAVELNWFLWAYEGRDVPRWDDQPAAGGGQTRAQVVAAYREAVARANAVVAACDDLDRPGARSLRETAPPTLRWVLVHMIEETGRHAGHADILRELYDGSVGR